jgi:opacity protein-like surface antigen
MLGTSNRAGRLVICLALLATSLLPAGRAVAGQWGHERTGMVLGFNLGAGGAMAKFDADGGSIETDRESGAGGNLRIGYAVSPQVVLGLETSGWSRNEDEGDVESTWSLGLAAFGATWYPAAGGFFLRAGIGVGRAEIEWDAGNGQTVAGDDTGFGLTTGLGYEWRLTRRFALGPQLDLNYVDIGDGISMNWFNATVGLNWFL